MRKTVLSIFLAMMIIFVVTYPALANENSILNAEYKDASINSISYTGWALNSIRIPDDTSMISGAGVVQGGVITYEAKVKVQVKNNGANYANRAITWSTTASASNVKIISQDTKTNASGIAYAIFHVRGVSVLPVKVSCSNVNASKTFDIGTIAMYNSNFQITEYIIANENDSYYTGSRISVPGLSGTYKRDFIEDVKLQGSGKSANGTYIRYINGQYSVGEPQTWSQTVPTAGRTIAVDPTFIPCVYSGGYRRGYVTIQGGIGQRIAEDRGGAIVGRHIDVFTGTGRGSLNGQDGYYQVLFNGVNTWGRYATNSNTLLDEAEDSAVLELVKQTENGKTVAYVSGIDYAKEHAVTVTVQTNAMYRSSPKNFELNRNVLGVDKMELSDNLLTTIGNVNPSMQIYQKFDIETGALINTLYGYGFIDMDDKIAFVQAPQHFSGVVGFNKIVDSEGNVYYESPENVVILSDLSYNDGRFVFTEMDVLSNEIERKNIDINVGLNVERELYYE